MDWLNFRHLYSFWMVNQSGGFSRAAVKMNVAQSAVSDQVSQLEEYLGDKLFIRTTRKVQLTDAGSRLYKYAEIIFENSREINRFIKDRESAGGIQNLNLGIVGGASRNFIFRQLEKVMTSNTNLQIQVATGSFEELYSLLKQYELDLLISLEIPRKKDIFELEYSRIGRSPMCLAGNKRLIGDIKSGRRKKAVSIYKFRHPYEVEILQRFVQPIIKKIPFQLRLTTEDIPLLRFFANSDDGIVIIPKVGILEDIDSEVLAHIELTKCPEINIYGVFMRNGVHQASINELLRVL